MLVVTPLAAGLEYLLKEEVSLFVFGQLEVASPLIGGKSK